MKTKKEKSLVIIIIMISREKKDVSFTGHWHVINSVEKISTNDKSFCDKLHQ